MTNALDRLLELKLKIARLNLGKSNDPITNQELNEINDIESQLESKLAQAEKYNEYVQSLHESSGKSMSLKELDDYLVELSQYKKDSQELSQLRPIVQALAIEFNKHKNHGEHCTCEYCYLLKDIPELKTLLATGEAKPN